MDATSTSLERRERGIHALRSGAGGARVTKARFLLALRPVAGRERTTINFSWPKHVIDGAVVADVLFYVRPPRRIQSAAASPQSASPQSAGIALTASLM